MAKHTRRAGWGAKSSLTYQQPPRWKALRLEVLKRDGFRCTAVDGNTNERCTARATDVDHIEGHSDETSNLASLCRHHHAMKTSRESAKKARAAREAGMLAAGAMARGLSGKIVPRGEASVGVGIDWKKLGSVARSMTR